jgi:Fe-S oxidoreductase
MKVLLHGWSTSPRLGVPEICDASVSILKKMGHEYVPHESKAICAEAIGFLGYDNLVDDLAKKMVKEMEEAVAKEEVDMILTSYAAPYVAWSKDVNGFLYKRGYELPVPIEHMSTFLYKNLDKLKFKELPMRILLHDGCTLGRKYGVVKEPREVLARIPKLEVLNFDHPELYVKERNLNPWDISACPGGWLDFTMPELMPYVASNVVREYAMPRNVDAIVATCGNGYHAFKAGIKHSNFDIKAYSYTNLIDLALEGVQ